MKEVSKEWLKGFIEGEGCFIIFIRITKNCKYPRIIFKCAIAQKEKQPLLDIQKYYDIGYIGRSGKACNCLYIESQKDITKLIDLLDATNWHTYKEQDYKLWKKALNLYRENHTGLGKYHGLMNTLYILNKINKIKASMNHH